MSIRLMNRVWDSVHLKGTELLLLLTIADHANEQGVCKPRQELLAKRVRCSVRQTRRLLRDLESGGYITVSDGRGRGKSATIRMNLPRLGSEPRAEAESIPLGSHVEIRIMVTRKGG